MRAQFLRTSAVPTPHNHSVSPYGGVRSYSYTPFAPTKSSNGFPGGGNNYSPFGSGGGYGDGYGDFGLVTR